MKKHLLKNLIWVLMLLTANLAWSQTRTVSGTVTAQDDGLPLPGVSVFVKGTRTGTQTNAVGHFSVTLPAGATTLTLSFIGYITQDVPVNGAIVNVKMVSSSKDLTEVVVTAYGQKRDKKALGYAVSTVAAKDLELRPESDIGRILNGKAPGLNILATSGLSGSGTNITIRGVSTITGSSQPLFVVDGVPFDGGTNANANFTFGTQTSSRFLDLDPNNIESVNILKGLSATTLYGEAGRNGVILITTKNGSTQQTKGKTEISVSQSIFATKAILPTYNTLYGGGFDLSTGIAFFSNWGAAFQNPPLIVAHPYDRAALAAAFPQFTGAPYEYKYYNSVPRFFRTGYSKITSVNIAGSSTNVNYNMSYAHTDETGYVQGNSLGKTNLGFGGTAKLTNKFTATGTVNVVKDNVLSPPTSNSTGNNATNTSVFGNVLYTPTAVDLIGLPYENPLDHSSVYYRSGNDIQNPLWTVHNSFTVDNTNRVFGQAGLKYDIFKDLNVLYRYGFDYYNEAQEYSQNKGGVGAASQGYLRTSSGNNKISDNTLTLNYNKNYSEKYSLNAIVGANSRDINYSQTGLYSTQQLIYGEMNHGNFVNHGVYSEDGSALNYINHTRTIGLFAQGTIGYYDYLYLALGGRNSWGSTVESNNRSIFYPSASLSFIPTSAIEALKNNKNINYLKVRVGYATSANFPFAYSTRASLFTSTKSFLTQGATAINVNAIPGLAPNPDLKPELSKEIEAGIEGKFFDNRLSIDFTAYKRISSDQILQQSLDPATGFTAQYINAGKVTNRGLEIAAGVTIVRSKTWRWQLDGQFTLNRSLVSDIPSSIGFINVAGFTNLGTIAQNGSPLGVIYGSYVQRDANGNRIVLPTGDYATAGDNKVIGDPNAKWKTTGINTISYKQFSFRFQVDYTFGGDIYSGTIGALLGRGVTADTEFDRARPVILPGVLANGQPNNIQISATQAYFNNNLPGGAPAESAIYDATNVRLREASFTYVLPAKFFTHTPIGSISISASGTNLIYYAPNFPKYTHFDPEASGLGVGNGKGLEFLTGPSARRFGGSVRVTF